MSNQKRKDLQGIRALAVTAVVLFHFIPNAFKNGYAGVDQFFILSGYLMAGILSKETKLTNSVLWSFYYRRMKRLLPLYALCILLTLIAILAVFPEKTFKYNGSYAIKSLMFMSNMHEEDASLTYERMVSVVSGCIPANKMKQGIYTALCVVDAKILFTHTWSLSVEIQFYALAPFIILASSRMSAGMYTLFLYGLCTISFFLFNYLFLWEETENVAFNLVFTRIWQFTIGIICSDYTRPLPDSTNTDKHRLLEENDNSDDNDSEDENGMSIFLSNLILLSVVFLILFPIEVSSCVVRILICLQTAGLIIAGTKVSNRLLSHKIIVYTGDISYSLYLVHWPIYVYFSQKQKELQFGLFIGFLLSIALAIILTEFYEKFYLGLQKKSILALCIFLYVANFAIILVKSPQSLYYQPDSFKQIFYVPDNITKEMAVDINEKFTTEDMAKLAVSECKYQEEQNKPWNLCTVNNTDFSGENTILIIGNSYATNLARMIVRNEDCVEKAKEMFVFASPSCEVLEDTTTTYPWCKGHNRLNLNIVKEHKPQYLFILTRHLKSMEKSHNGELDSILTEEMQILSEIQQFVQEKIFILDAIPRPLTTITEIVNSNLKKGIMVPQDSLMDASANFELARSRVSNLPKFCGKCELIDVMPTFMQNSKFQAYDTENGILYFTDGLHFTDYGLDKVRPIFSKICKKL